MNARQWMPLYIPDYLKDTSHLSTLEHGAYLLLLMHYWTKGSLPDNEIQLARIARVTARDWKAMREVLAGLFLDGWKHKRVEKELAEAQARYEKRANAATAAAESRWGTGEEKKTRFERLSAAREKGTHTDQEWSVLESLFDCCVRCGTPRANLLDEKLCKDHVTSIYQGGSDAIENLQPMCRECNSKKGKKAEDFRSERLPDWREMYAKRMRLASQTDASEHAKAMPNAGARDRARQTQSHFSEEKDAALDGRAARDLNQIEDRLRTAGRLEDSPRPGLKILAPILGLMDQGLSLEEDILPIVRARSHPRVNSWAFFTEMILDARASRSAASQVRSSAPARPISPSIDRPRSGSASAMAGVVAAATKFGGPQ